MTEYCLQYTTPTETTTGTVHFSKPNAIDVLEFWRRKLRVKPNTEAHYVSGGNAVEAKDRDGNLVMRVAVVVAPAEVKKVIKQKRKVKKKEILSGTQV